MISHRPVRLSCSITALWKSGPLCATLGSREQLSAKPFRRSLRDRAAISVYVRVAQDRCLSKLQPEADFTPVWLSWTWTRYPYHRPVFYTAPPSRPENKYQLRLDKLKRCLGSRGEVQQHRPRSQISKRNPCRLPIDERPGPSLRTPVEERSLHGIWRRGLAVASSQSHCPRNSPPDTAPQWTSGGGWRTTQCQAQAHTQRQRKSIVQE